MVRGRPTRFSGEILTSRNVWPDGILSGLPADIVHGVNPRDVSIPDASFSQFTECSDVAATPTRCGPFLIAQLNGAAAATAGSAGEGPFFYMDCGSTATAHHGQAARLGHRGTDYPIYPENGDIIAFVARFHKTLPAEGGLILGLSSATGATGLLSGSSSNSAVNAILFNTVFDSAALRVIGSTGGAANTVLDTTTHTMTGAWITVALRIQVTVAAAASQVNVVTSYIKVGNNSPVRLSGPTTTAVGTGICDTGVTAVAAVTKGTATTANSLQIRAMALRRIPSGEI